MNDGIGREEYVRLLCRGYLIIGKPIPEEFWDEWEEILAKDAALVPPSAGEKLLELAPDPLEVWAVLKDGSQFELTRSKPSIGNHVTLEGTSPYTGIVDHCVLQRPDGTLLAKFNISNVNTVVAGDSLHVTLDATQMLKMLMP
jgi:hypothetical protein